ncbi:protein adenylyltransferase SelO family protein [Psychromonas sp. 14N.309.X.WAT.B.A12]|uniref:protein adenylyltransferase SelO n=1 Tax=Psychromonas sp. 14N.309.X.WAT.B.A12 TaxID=2998322 RepID=UPI0025B0721A|nr:protein adenylyltransferase SelO family protein [Psychromonas sp. 14N.309.X.WAT.B.A12]MDN2663710.1 protein adenylyltransferase SelO family protein [Psychromonas sp. 14N.309.X.WAT.B.A12]
MTNQQPQKKNSTTPIISTFSELANLANYSFMDRLNCDPDATENGVDHTERQVFSGHYVPVKPTPIKDPQYVAHSKRFFAELGLADGLAESADFMRLFSGDITQVPEPMRKVGWATGYALSIYGVEFIHQCPFQTGNGYGDGRAISVLEAVINGQRWEMQLKGGGRTPYCRGADGRAVLRSSVREFLAQDHMHALGVATSRSLSLYVSKTETVQRGWYAEGSRSENPDMMVTEPVAISTRVAPSFLRVGQIELFARRTRDDGEYDEQLHAIDELEKIVLHLIDREYAEVIDKALSTPEKIVQLTGEFRERLTSLIANWIRVGFCQGNFNSDNCAAGGFTLDYGPFGFSDLFNPHYQPWTGGGNHFSFMNQPKAAQSNFEMFCSALKPLLATDQDALSALEDIQSEFSTVMESKMQAMWAAKLGLSSLDKPEHMAVLRELQMIMMQTPIDYTIFFRELSSIPNDIRPLKKSFYTNLMHKSAEQEAESQQVDTRWIEWFVKWKALLISDCNANAGTTLEDVSKQMKQVNPKYILREWLLKPAYQQAAVGDDSLIQELQEVMANPYEEQSQSVEDKFYRLKPLEFFNVGGVSHLSCSS